MKSQRDDSTSGTLPGSGATDGPHIDSGPFGIDGPGYSDRDREMFVLGCQFMSAWGAMNDPGESEVIVLEANRGRIEDACREAGRDHEFVPIGGGWASFRFPAAETPS